MICSIWGRDGCGMCRARSGCSRSGRPACGRNFRPLRGVDSNPGNLRPAITSLIGRDAEVSNLQAALRSHRLVTLAGVGGVGKTRLALEVATQLADEFVDGVWFFELAAVADPAAVPDAVAAVLGITQQPGKSVSESVASALEGRSRLLVFDNCEHVVDSVADLVAAILAASATVKVLATSREGIGVADEQLWRVPSLDVGAAVELFVERAQSMVSDTLADEATAVEDVCRRLDGIPLAIELAASRMASMTAAEVRDRLDDRFKLLVGSRRGLERHQTLRHAVAWSYDLLDDAEKTVLERCSVFAGGFDLESACAVAGSDEHRVPLRTPGRSGPANGRESTADECARALAALVDGAAMAATATREPEPQAAAQLVRTPRPKRPTEQDHPARTGGGRASREQARPRRQRTAADPRDPERSAA